MPQQLSEQDSLHLMELSLRHLPDLSEASFQIPVTGGSEDLLADNSGDFLKGMNCSFMASPQALGPIVDKKFTPSRLTRQYEPFALGELTPKPKHNFEPPASSSPPEVESQGKAGPAKQMIQPAVKALRQKLGETLHGISNQAVESERPQVVVETPREKLRKRKAEVKRTTREETASVVPGSSGIGNPKISQPEVVPPNAAAAPSSKTATQPGDEGESAGKRTIAEIPVSKSIIVAPAAPRLRQPGRKLTPSSTQFGPSGQAGNERNVDNPAGAAVERLLMYGQALMKSTDPFALGIDPRDNREPHHQIPDRDSYPPACQSNAPSPTVPSANEALTLSQLSPAKIGSVKPSSTIGSLPPPPPVTRSMKRAAPTECVATQSKKGKADTHTSSQSGKITVAKQPRSKRPNFASRSRVVGVRKPRRHGHTSPSFEDANLGGSSAGASCSKGEQDPHTRSLNQNTGLPAEAIKSKITVNSVPTLNLTKPVEFKFRLDSRLAVRHDGHANLVSEGPVSNGSVRQVPDFNVRHANAASQSASRKENIPVVPVQRTFYTEVRAKEREKFDQMIQAKEAIVEQQKMERRIQEELEEQKAIKELRKKAIPKAHEVPSWYANAPRRMLSRSDKHT